MLHSSIDSLTVSIRTFTCRGNEVNIHAECQTARSQTVNRGVLGRKQGQHHKIPLALSVPLRIPSRSANLSFLISSISPPRQLTHHLFSCSTSFHPPFISACIFFGCPPRATYIVSRTVSQCGGGFAREYVVVCAEPALGKEMLTTEEVSKLEGEALRWGDAENPFMARTSAGGTVILPCLKQICDIETVWRTEPSASSMCCWLCSSLSSVLAEGGEWTVDEGIGVGETLVLRSES